MNIPISKQISFLEKIISDTKSNKVYWDPIPYNSIAAQQTFPFAELDQEGVFSCGFPRNLDGFFLIAATTGGNVLGAIGTSYEHMMPFATKNDQVSVLLFRLFNLIFAERPSANQIIDNYLATEPDD